MNLTHPHHTLLPQEEPEKLSFPSPSLTNYSGNSPPTMHEPYHEQAYHEQAYHEQAYHEQAYHPTYQTHLVRDSIHKRNIRALKLLARTLTLGLATYGLVSQILTLNKYLATRNIIRNDRNAWASGAYIWPTIVLLIVSGLTVLVSLATMASYCFSGVKRANTINTRLGLPAAIVEHLAHLAVWIATAVAYKLGNTGKDLWGWTCDPKALEIQSVFPEVPFQAFCNMQTGSWAVSLAEVVLVMCTAVVWVYAWRRERRRKGVRRSMGMDVKGAGEGWSG